MNGFMIFVKIIVKVFKRSISVGFNRGRTKKRLRETIRNYRSLYYQSILLNHMKGKEGRNFL